MVRQLKVDIAARAARLRFVALAWLASACGGSPVAPADEPEAEPQVVDIVAEPVTMAESAQLLDNASMEAGASLPDEWWSGAPDGSDIVVEWIDTAAASGSRSLSIRRDSLATTGFAFWAQTLEVDNPVGVTFELSVSIQLADVFGEGVSIAIRGDNSALGNCCAEAFATTQGRRTIAGTHDWTIHTVKLNSVPADVDRITVYFVFLPNTSGTALFDDATLSASVTVPTLELQNTDMENGDGYPEPWWWGGPGYENYDFVWSNAEASSGGRSLRSREGSDTPSNSASGPRRSMRQTTPEARPHSR